MATFISSILLPPFSLIILLAISLTLWHKKKRLGKPIAFITLALLWISSTPLFSDFGLQLLEKQTKVVDLQQRADAIVILGGGNYAYAPEYDNNDTVSYRTLVRLRYGARLHRETGKPILVTGGSPFGAQIPEAQTMRSTLEQDFKVPVIWMERNSDTTFDNAKMSYAMLQRAGINKIYLVTHAWHMPRAADIFRRAGFEVIEAPTGFTTRHRNDLRTFIPSAKAMLDSYYFAHELTGLLWYQFKNPSSKN